MKKKEQRKLSKRKEREKKVKDKVRLIRADKRKAEKKARDLEWKYREKKEPIVKHKSPDADQQIISQLKHNVEILEALDQEASKESEQVSISGN